MRLFIEIYFFYYGFILLKLLKLVLLVVGLGSVIYIFMGIFYMKII